MHETLFRICIWAVSLAHIIAVIYGLSAYSADTITAHMIAHVDYRITLSVCVVIEIIVWFLCVWAKQTLCSHTYALSASSTHSEAALGALFFLIAVLISWISLSTILTTSTHIIFVGILFGCFLIFILLLTYLTRQPEAGIVLRISILLLVISAVAMLSLFNSDSFYIAEHFGFFVYILTFLAFFSIHTYPHWAEETDSADLDEYECIWENWDNVENEKSHNLHGTYYAGRGGLVWIPN